MLSWWIGQFWIVATIKTMWMMSSLITGLKIFRKLIPSSWWKSFHTRWTFSQSSIPFVWSFDLNIYLQPTTFIEGWCGISFQVRLIVRASNSSCIAVVHSGRFKAEWTVQGSEGIDDDVILGYLRLGLDMPTLEPTTMRCDEKVIASDCGGLWPWVSPSPNGGGG